MSHYDEFQPYDKPSIDSRKNEDRVYPSPLDFSDDNYLQFAPKNNLKHF